ncbi:MAG: hypothetical protein M0Z48_08185 [Nitrospiraceae bacterium]|nr:hypothetical protein [Nitrospiraceae bacterium]
MLGDTSVYNPFLKDKARVFFAENDASLVRNLAEDTAKTCIFCGENVFQKTARYPAELIPEGRIHVGEAVLFANTFSIGKYHPVVALSSAHFLKLSEFTSEMLADGFKAAQQFLIAVRNKDASVAFATVNANYLLPAGASLVHPHLQMLITKRRVPVHIENRKPSEPVSKLSQRRLFSPEDAPIRADIQSAGGTG